MKKLLNKLFERLGYVPKSELDHKQHLFDCLLEETREANRLFEEIGKCNRSVNYRVYGEGIWGYGVLVEWRGICKTVKYFPCDYGADYAKLCAEELCEKLNERT